MTRFNYAPARRERFIADSLAGIRTAGVRLSIGLVGASILLVTAMWSLEARHLAQLDDDLAILRTQARAVDAAAYHAGQLQTTLRRLRAIGVRVALARRAAITTTNEVALIGNSLPSRTWLTSVQATPDGGWSISGRSTQLVEIGTTLSAIQHLDDRAPARLLSVSAGGRTGRTLDFVIGWDRRS